MRQNKYYVIGSLFVSALMVIPASALFMIGQLVVEFLFQGEPEIKPDSMQGAYYHIRTFLIASFVVTVVSIPVTIGYGGLVYFVLKKMEQLNLLALLLCSLIPTIMFVALGLRSMHHIFIFSYFSLVNAGVFWWLVHRH